ncbi:B3 domain-containing protein [Apostasia shenzhenica]|uniref:B3 domain-containing protein n=1 Tax=Apostasia shenzhenica TaxID=1088818 RepID=A0A2I0AZI3_9ASPA|nr:B3 domain-containing protein [Apostasia shenzhenica]
MNSCTSLLPHPFVFTSKRARSASAFSQSRAAEGESSLVLKFGLVIPKKFMDYFSVELLEAVELKVPSGNIWHVSLRKTNDRAALECGWRKFIEDHDIQENDTLDVMVVVEVRLMIMGMKETHFPPNHTMATVTAIMIDVERSSTILTCFLKYARNKMLFSSLDSSPLLCGTKANNSVSPVDGTGGMSGTNGGGRRGGQLAWVAIRRSRGEAEET